MKSFDYNTYLSPFTWRYGSSEMRTIWSEIHKRKLWRKIWVALAKAQYKQGLVSKKELDDLIKQQETIDIEKADTFEKEIHHDLMAEIKTYESQATVGGGKIHLGATSMDIEDNADSIRYKESFVIIEKKVQLLITSFAEKIKQYKALPCMAYTHLQPAEPTTLGYRFCLYAQDLLFDLKLLNFVQTMNKGKGMKGAVGTAASYVALLSEEKAQTLEADVLKTLGIESVSIASQTAPRKIEFFISTVLSSIAQSLYKFAFDVRIMQSPGFIEWQEPFGKKQVGSSAMPFKRNPIKSEQICSLARLITNLANTSKDNAMHMLLERTLDDSANRRIYLAEMFLATDTILDSAKTIIERLVINEKNIEKNLERYGPFAATESLMMHAVKNGANRQTMHELFREQSMLAYKTMEETDINPLEENLLHDKTLFHYLSPEAIKKMLNPRNHLGLAEKTCTTFLQTLNDEK